MSSDVNTHTSFLLRTYLDQAIVNVIFIMASPNSELLFFLQLMKILAEIRAEFSAEMLNYLLDQLNERSNLNFLLMYFAAK